MIVYCALLSHDKQTLNRNHVQQPVMHIPVFGIRLSEENYKKGFMLIFIVSKASG